MCQRLLLLPWNLENVRLAVSIHLDIKNAVPLLSLLEKGCKLFVTTCNPATTRLQVVEELKKKGAHVEASSTMSAEEWAMSIANAAKWAPTHLCDMGGSLTKKCIELNVTSVLVGMEGTGSGVHALQSLQNLSFPVFDWNDISLKEGIHNRHMVGIAATHAFFNRTHLTFHRKNVVVVGFGPVGQGCCEASTFYGGAVCVVDRDPAAVFKAEFAGYRTYRSLDDVLPTADVIITATGAAHVIREEHVAKMKNGCFILNVGHFASEVDTEQIYSKFEHKTVLDFVEEVIVETGNSSKSVFMFADGKMANLVAGYGDSINAFDVTLAIMVAALRFITIAEPGTYQKGLQLLPESAWKYVLDL